MPAPIPADAAVVSPPPVSAAAEVVAAAAVVVVAGTEALVLLVEVGVGVVELELDDVVVLITKPGLWS